MSEVGPPVLAGGAPGDPKSIGVWPTFLAACRAWAGILVPLSAALAIVLVPTMTLLFVAAPTFASILVGGEAQAIPAGEWFALAGVVLLMLVFGALASGAGARIADRALAGADPPGLGPAFAFALDRLLPLLGSYGLLLAMVLVPYALLFALMVVAALATGDGGASGTATVPLLVLLLGALVLVPVVAAIALYARFGWVRAVLRDEGPVASLKGSLALVRGRWWRVASYVGLVGIVLQGVLTAALMTALLAFGPGSAPAFATYALTCIVFIPFQTLHDVALMRRLEELDARAGMPTGPESGGAGVAA